MATIKIHAGHNPANMTACGAVGILNESAEAREIVFRVINILRNAGHTVIDCTCNNGTSQNDVLKKIVEKDNAHPGDLTAAVHLNSGRNDYVGDGSIGGTEVFVFNRSESNKVAIAYAKSVVDKIAELGFRIRDDAIPDHIKENSQLYVLRKTKDPAILIECCFVDDKDDADLYNVDSMAKAIADGILAVAGKTAVVTPQPAPAAPATSQQVASGHHVGETISYNGIYTTAMSSNRLNPRKTTGVITKIKSGAKNPYLIDGGTGWTNDACILTSAPAAPVSHCYPAYTGGSDSISQALRSMGIDSSFNYRAKMSAANGITGYRGTYQQNVTMLTLLKRGQLKTL